MADIGKTYALDATGDLVLQYGRLVPVIGTDKAVQDLTVLLRSIKGSALLSPEFGLDARQFWMPGEMQRPLKARSGRLWFSIRT